MPSWQASLSLQYACRSSCYAGSGTDSIHLRCQRRQPLWWKLFHPLIREPWCSITFGGRGNILGGSVITWPLSNSRSCVCLAAPAPFNPQMKTILSTRSQTKPLACPHSNSGSEIVSNITLMTDSYLEDVRARCKLWMTSV